MICECEYCKSVSTHIPGCPNYVPPETDIYCSICKDGIYEDEEYVLNIDDECVHYECLTDLSYRRMIEWLGGEIKRIY